MKIILFYTNKLFILISRSQNEAWFLWCSTLNSNSIRQAFLNDVRNSLASFIAQKASTNLKTQKCIKVFIHKNSDVIV